MKENKGYLEGFEQGITPAKRVGVFGKVEDCQPIIEMMRNYPCGRDERPIDKIYAVRQSDFLEIRQLLQDIIKWEEANFIEADLLERIKCLEDRMKM